MLGDRCALSIGAVVCLLSWGGCVAPVDDAEAVGVGRLVLPLEVSAGSHHFRLRNAMFEVSGPTTTTIYSEDALGEQAATADLSIGTYEILLQPGWALEETTEDGPLHVEASVISDNPIVVQVLGDSISRASFDFATAGVPVSAGLGRVDVQLTVQLPTSCDPLDSEACAAGLHCYPDAFEPPGLCHVPGQKTRGQHCSYNHQCEPNHVCEQDYPGGARCAARCSVFSGGCFGGACTPIGEGPLGYCAGAITQSCDPLGLRGCGQGDACYADRLGNFTCEPGGVLPLGADCTAPEQCAPGLSCVQDNNGKDICLEVCAGRRSLCRIGNCIPRQGIFACVPPPA